MVHGDVVAELVAGGQASLAALVQPRPIEPPCHGSWPTRCQRHCLGRWEGRWQRSGCPRPPRDSRLSEANPLPSPSDLFRDGMFYRCGSIIQAEHIRRRHERYRSTLWHEIVFPAQDVYIIGLVVLPDASLDFGNGRFYDFDLDLETRPRGALTPREVRVQTPQRLVEKWGDC